jgi:hypothetical protein
MVITNKIELTTIQTNKDDSTDSPHRKPVADFEGNSRDENYVPRSLVTS